MCSSSSTKNIKPCNYLMKNKVFKTTWDKTMKNTLIQSRFFRDIEILGWCPAGWWQSYLMGRRLATLAFVGHPSSDGVTIKMPYGVDQLCTPSFFIGLVKPEHSFIVRSVETCLGRWALVVALISIDACPFFDFLRPDLSPWRWRRPNLEVVSKRPLHQQVKILG